MTPSYNSYEEKNTFRLDKILWPLLFIFEILLGIRFALRFVGSNTITDFSAFVYNITQPLVSPFLKALGIYGQEGSTFEWATPIAMVIYWIIVWAINKIFLTDDAILTPESERKNK